MGRSTRSPRRRQGSRARESRPPLLSRPEIRFLLLFLVLLVTGFGVVALRPVNDVFVDPYTALVARAAGWILRILGEDITIRGCLLASPRFSVTIFNGCNGLITTLIFLSAVLAFPVGWRARLIGVVGGIVSIQVINMIRIVSLYYIGAFFPSWFNNAHVVIWQSIVILAGVALWVFWASRYGRRPAGT